MLCPKCKSKRIQRDYDDAALPTRLIGRRRVLCNNCGAVFSAFDPLGKIKRAPTKTVVEMINRRRGPRFHAHIPAAISLIEEGKKNGKATYSEPSRGHCETINKFGMGLSLVGTKFSETDLARGRRLFVRLDLSTDSIEAVVSIANHFRIGEERKRKWVLGVKIVQMSDADKKRLEEYLEQRAKDEPHVVWE